MRTHYLSQLQIDGRDRVLSVVPELDLYGAQRVVRLEVDFGTNETARLSVEFVYDGGGPRYRLGLRFEGVRELVLPRMSSLLQLSEIEIEDVRDRMLEGINFEVVSHFDYSFRCSCREIFVDLFEAI